MYGSLMGFPEGKAHEAISSCVDLGNGSLYWIGRGEVIEVTYGKVAPEFTHVIPGKMLNIASPLPWQPVIQRVSQTLYKL